MSKPKSESETQARRPGAVSRRNMLSNIGALGAGFALGATLPACKKDWLDPEDDPTGIARYKPYVPGAEDYGTFEERWRNTSCHQCPAGCGVRVRVVEGRAVRIEGNPDNPLNRGGIGPRGLSGLQALYDADRITQPLVRKGDELVPTSWKEALALLTGKLKQLRDRGEAHRLLVLSGLERGFVHELFGRFCHTYGTPNWVDGRPGHSAVLAQAVEACMGPHELPAFAWPDVDYVLSLEAGLLEDSCQTVYLARVAAELRRGRRARRTKLVHAGAMFDLSAYNADEWLRIAPGTGGALALGMCHLLLRDYGLELQSLKDTCDGFEAFQELAARFPPEVVAATTGLAPERISNLAAELWRSRPALAVADERSVSFSNGLAAANAVLALNALLFANRGVGAGVRVAEPPPYRPWPEPVVDDIASRGLAHARLDRAGTGEFPRAHSVQETLPEAILGAGADRPEVALLHYTNPVWARQQPRRWREALDAIPFVVSFSPYRDESVAEVADLVLPDHTYLERWEDAAAAPVVLHTVAGVRSPVIEPLHDTRSTGDVLISVARELGGALAASFPWNDRDDSFRVALDQRLLGLHDADRGTIRIADEREFLTRIYEEGFWAETEPLAASPVRFHFQASWAEPMWDGDEDKFPLKLLAYRPLGYAVGSGANEPWLHTLRSRPGMATWTLPASMHPETPGFSVSDGDDVVVTSPWGSITLPVRLDERLERGHVAIPLGGGHTALGRWAKGVGVNVMEILRPGPAPESGANVLCATRVRVDKAKGG